MKKIKFIAVLITLTALTVLSPIGEVTAAPDVSVKVDGNLLTFPDQKPYINSDDRTMVPVRTPMEAIGCEVKWDDKARKATISKNGNVAEFTIGSNSYTVNSNKKTMDTKAVIAGERTSFPIRFAAEAMGATVDWDAATNTVNISTNGGVKPGLVYIKKDLLPFAKQGNQIPYYETTIPFTSIKGTEIVALEYRDGNLKLVMAKKPVEMIYLYTDFGGGAVTNINGKDYYEVARGYESEFKGPDNIELIKQFNTLKLFIPDDGLYEFPNPFK